MENARTRDQLAEANQNAAKARDDYEHAAAKLLHDREDEWTRTGAAWAAKEKELDRRALDAKTDLGAAQSEAKREAERANRAKSQVESKLANVQSRLTAANGEIARLRSQVVTSRQHTDQLLKSSNTDIQNWLGQQLASLPPMNSRHEVRVALRKHEMGRQFDAEHKLQDRLVHQAAGTLVFGKSESGLAYRSVILQYSTISAPISASVTDVKLAYRWTVNKAATSLDPGDDDKIISYSGVAGSSPDGSKDLRFDFRKTDERFQKLDTMSPIEYKGEHSRLVFCMRFKERGDPTPRLLVFQVNAIERSK